jgi:hypothetical protein
MEKEKIDWGGGLQVCMHTVNLSIQNPAPPAIGVSSVLPPYRSDSNTLAHRGRTPAAVAHSGSIIAAGARRAGAPVS